MEHKEHMKLACYNCKHLGEIKNSTYIYCKNRKAKVEGHPSGIIRGWFDWPYEFHPVWLIKCDGFERKVGDNCQR